jgi:hypothetical protein
VEADQRVIARFMLAGGFLVSLLEPAPAQDWADRFPPAAECEPRWGRSQVAEPELVSAGKARVIVILEVLGEAGRPPSVQADLVPVIQPLPNIRATTPENSTPIRVLDADTTGPHVLSLRGIGYSRFVDTLDVRPGYSDTIQVWLQDSNDDYRNKYNCRPRGFRRAGESACVTDSAETGAVLARAREFAGTKSLKALGISPFDSSRVFLVRQEKTCRRAARLYGEANDPPRRVVVVRIGPLYLVYDPYEPLPAGEWNIWRLFNRRWRPLFDIMG